MKNLMYRKDIYIYDHFKFLLELDKPIVNVTEDTIWLANWVETRVGTANNLGYPTKINNQYYWFDINKIDRFSILPISQDNIEQNTVPEFINLPSIQLQGGISGIRASYEVQVDRLQQNSILQFEIRNRSNLITAFTFEDIWLPINTKWFCVLFNNFNLDLTPEQIGAPYNEQ